MLGVINTVRVLPWRLAGTLGLMVTGYFLGYQHRDGTAAEEKLEAMVEIEADAKLQRQHTEAIAGELERMRRLQRRADRVIIQEVDRVVTVYRDRVAECLDADGLRVVAAALCAPDADSCEPQAAVPGSGPAR